MTTLALKDVAVILDPKRFFNPPGKPNEAYPSITFGDGALTYDTYGIPVPPPGDFGMLNEILRILIQAPPDGYEYRYDPTPRTATPVAPYGTIRIFQSNGVGTVSFPALAVHTHDIKVVGGGTATEPVAIQGGDTLVKAAATDRTIAGAASATKGGVVAVSAGTPVGTAGGSTGPMVELGAVAVAATVLPLIVIGQ